MRFWEMSRRAIAEPLGVRAKAIAGVELALLDIKARLWAYRWQSCSGARRGTR